MVCAVGIIVPSPEARRAPDFRRVFLKNHGPESSGERPAQPSNVLVKPLLGSSGPPGTTSARKLGHQSATTSAPFLVGSQNFNLT